MEKFKAVLVAKRETRIMLEGSFMSTVLWMATAPPPPPALCCIEVGPGPVTLPNQRTRVHITCAGLFVWEYLFLFCRCSGYSFVSAYSMCISHTVSGQPQSSIYSPGDDKVDPSAVAGKRWAQANCSVLATRRDLLAMRDQCPSR